MDENFNMTPENLHDIIMNAKIGEMRKDAQIETCTVFAAALGDLLKNRKIEHTYLCVSPKTPHSSLMWYHTVIGFAGKMFDSYGLFNADILKKRQKLKIDLDLLVKNDVREDVDEEFSKLYIFFVKKLEKSFAEFEKTINHQLEIAP
jgi:hypothetical protein